MKNSLFAAVLLFVTSSAAKAQTPAEVLTTIKPGVTLRLHSPATERLTGKFAGVISDSVRLRNGNSATSYPIAPLDSIWKLKRYTRAGAIVGGAGLGVAGGALFAALIEAVSESENPETFKAFVFGFGFFGAGGALIGGTIGHFITNWQLLHPERR